jgi:hypothetical protein
VFCFGDHPTNYRGCPSFKNIQNLRNHHSSQTKKNHLNNNIRYQDNNNVPFHISHKIISENQKTPTLNQSYAQAAENKNTNTPKNQFHLDTTTQLTAQLT